MIIIPARLKSTRFPNKILEPIFGIPMLIRVANIAKSVDEVAIATDDIEVQKVCEKYGFRAILTSSTHESGTDRIAECAKKLKLNTDEIIINVQGDEPFLEKEVILTLKNLMLERKKRDGKYPFMATCIKEISAKEAENPNLVKAIFNHDGDAIYFSRAKIPYDREGVMGENKSYYGHLGIYAFSAKSLQEFCELPKSNLEEIEKLEQLRAIENGKKIAVVKVESESFGIDTKEDLALALQKFKDRI